MACEHCTDPDGSPCYPQYGLAPHLHGTGPGLAIGTHFKPKAVWPSNFMEDLENPNHGIWWCEHCGDGKPETPNAELTGPEPLAAKVRVERRVRAGDASEADMNLIEKLAREHGTGGWQTLEDMMRFGEAVVAAERERICAAIKAEDNHCADGDYMMDSDDCIKVVLGTWERPDWNGSNA